MNTPPTPFRDSMQTVTHDLKWAAPWIVAGLLVVLGVMFFVTLFREAEKRATVPVKILKVQSAVPGTKLGVKTLVEFPDGRRALIKGDYGNAGESFLYNTNNYR